MFLGEYYPNITNGSRLALPKKLRDLITGDDIILSRGFEKCIFLYDRGDWMEEAVKHVDNPISDPKTRELKRYMYSSASETSIDSQGRLVIPQNLKDYAALDLKVTVIGAGDHIEIWDFANWQKHISRLSVSYALGDN